MVIKIIKEFLKSYHIIYNNTVASVIQLVAAYARSQTQL